MKAIRLLLLTLLLASCHYSREEGALYQVGDNFELAADSLMLQSSQPLHNLPVDTLCEQMHVSMGDPLVVAEVLVIPEDMEDSVWVKLARDQFTMGWVHQRDFLASVVPDDPISQFIHILNTSRPEVLGIFFAVSLVAMLWQILSRKRPHVFLLRDILSPYPTALLIVLAASALFYAGIQHYAPETWLHYYHHPTLNPFGLPPVLSLFLCSVWVSLILVLATISEVFWLLPAWEALLYLLSLLGCCMLPLVLFASPVLSPGISYMLFALLSLVLLLRYYRHSRARFLCGSCGKRLQKLGKCPYCGAENR